MKNIENRKSRHRNKNGKYHFCNKYGNFASDCYLNKKKIQQYKSYQI